MKISKAWFENILIKSKNTVKIVFLYGFCVCFALFFLWQNNYIQTTRYTYKNEKIPESFDGYKIVHVSDTHGKWFGQSHSYICSVIKREKPDIIVITGDSIDKRRPDINSALTFMLEAKKIAPTYYVSGNQEAEYENFDGLLKLFEATGVEVLDGKSVKLSRLGETMYISGFSDSNIASLNSKTLPFAHDADGKVAKAANKLVVKNEFNIMLAHRPEFYDIYENSEADLVLCGHAHGGQVRLPFTNGIFAPGQGYFPKYTSGVHTFGKTSLIISRGLGNSQFPLRLFNFPEVVSITLNKN